MHHLYQRPGFLLRRVHQISTAIFERACAHLSLTPAQYGVLSVIEAQPGIDQSSLARALAFDKVTVLRVLRGLEERGLCVRVPEPLDRRQMSTRLTAAGKKWLKLARAPVQRAYEELLHPLNAKEREALLSILSKLNRDHEDQARASFVPLGQDPSN